MTDRPIRRTTIIAIGFCLGAAVVLAPVAQADPPDWPEPGTESAAATVGDLDELGYDVQFNYENGTPDVPLSQCTVSNIDTVGSDGAQPLAYVTITCASGDT